MSEQIKRYGFNFSGRLVKSKSGAYCVYLDVEAARAADKAEIERLTNICKLWEQRYESTISVAEARIAELEAASANLEKLYNAAVDNYNEIVRKPNPQGERRTE